MAKFKILTIIINEFKKLSVMSYLNNLKAYPNIIFINTKSIK